MGRHFDYSDWTLAEICDSIREHIAESRKPLPPKVMRHSVSIVFVTDLGCGTYTHPFSSYDIGYMRYETREDAEKLLDSAAWVKRTGENSWTEIDERRTYVDRDGNTVLCHYEIREHDYEEYEDGDSHFEYDDAERAALSQCLRAVETARAYLRAFDYCCDEYDFGNGAFAGHVREELDAMESEYTEELPDDYYSDDD